MYILAKRFQVKKFDLKVASAGTVESFVQSPSAQGSMEPKSVLGGQALLQKLEADLEALESHLVELNTYNERLTSEYNEKVGVRSGSVRSDACSFELLWLVYAFFCPVPSLSSGDLSCVVVVVVVVLWRRPRLWIGHGERCRMPSTISHAWDADAIEFPPSSSVRMTSSVVYLYPKDVV